MEIRFEVLSEIMKSHSIERRILGLNAAEQCLHSGKIILFNLDDLHGLKNWSILQPSVNEIIDYQLKMWNLLCRAMDTSEKDEKHNGQRPIVYHRPD